MREYIIKAVSEVLSSASIPNTHVFISAGNHDPLTSDSLYNPMPRVFCTADIADTKLKTVKYKRLH